MLAHTNTLALYYRDLKIARGVHPTKAVTGEREKEKRDDADGKYPCNDYRYEDGLAPL